MSDGMEADIPLGLAGEDIPLEGRITAAADVFDALSSRAALQASVSAAEMLCDYGRRSWDSSSTQIVLDAFFRLP
jgi:putative two-component system response regulator